MNVKNSVTTALIEYHPLILTVLLIYMWMALPVTHKDKYLEVHNSIICSVVSQEGLNL